MYSQQLQDYIKEISQLADLSPDQIHFLDESLACYLSVFSKAVGGQMTPPADLLSTSLQLAALSIGLSEMSDESTHDGSHYLVAMGLEQTGELLFRSFASKHAQSCGPLQNDYFFRLLLAFLHYMVGDFRVQALSALRNIDRISKQVEDKNLKNDYDQVCKALWDLFRGRSPRGRRSVYKDYLFGDQEPSNPQALHIYSLAKKIRQRRQAALLQLGLGHESKWLANRKIYTDVQDGFWTRYLEKLGERGFTSFTKEQVGNGFDRWLIPESDLLVLLPTGSGKSLIGELKTALTLAQGAQAVWMLPTRALVRQAKRELSSAFGSLGVEVEELPTTEDYIPVVTDDIPLQRLVAATTPEKMAALLRSNKDSISKLGLVILDEAQILFENRGTITEYVLQEIRRLSPECRFVFMTAFDTVLEQLSNFMKKLLDEEPEKLVSNRRPTRRINGIVTNYTIGKKDRPVILIYPPGIQAEQQVDEHPYQILLEYLSLKKKISKTDLASSVSTSLLGTQLKGVMFASTIPSAEAQSVDIAGKASKSLGPIQLPPEEIDRLNVELGRTSVIEETAKYRVSSHHGSLCPLEQHIVEKWTRKGIVNLVVATPTLAQGVNLPFDVSIVSFVTLSKQDNYSEREVVPIPEIMNMLGRAGRAGYVSDGLCLVAVESKGGNRLKTLNGARKYFFRENEQNKDYLGLANLLQVGIEAKIDDPSWLIQLSSMNLSQAQTLTSFCLQVATENDEQYPSISARLALFPSIQNLSQEKITDISTKIETLVKNIISTVKGDTELVKVIAQTGLPIALLERFVEAMRGNSNLRTKSVQDVTLWADTIIFDALRGCQDTTWYKLFIQDFHKDLTLDALQLLVDMWRNGASLAEIEKEVRLGRSNKDYRINIGKLINRKISLIAQFWGALAVCDSVLYPNETRRPFELVQTCVREGVSSVLELAWLEQLGGMDRVLAHRLASITPVDDLPSDNRSLSKYIRRRMNRWKTKEEIIPVELSVQEAGALRSILDE